MVLKHILQILYLYFQYFDKSFMILFWIYFPNLVGLDGFEEASRQEKFSNEVDNLHCTEDGEAGEESHGAADQTQLSIDCDLHISFYVVIGPRVKVDLNHFQWHKNVESKTGSFYQSKLTDCLVMVCPVLWCHVLSYSGYCCVHQT